MKLILCTLYYDLEAESCTERKGEKKHRHGLLSCLDQIFFFDLEQFFDSNTEYRKLREVFLIIFTNSFSP